MTTPAQRGIYYESSHDNGPWERRDFTDSHARECGAGDLNWMNVKQCLDLVNNWNRGGYNGLYRYRLQVLSVRGISP